MPGPRNAKLEKLQILVFQDRKRNQRVGRLELMFNPESVSLKYKTRFDTTKPIGRESREARYVCGEPAQSLPLTMLVDGTGVAHDGPPVDVAAKVNEFLDLCVMTNGSIHEPNYLRLQWGTGVLQSFDCRVAEVTVDYTSFARNGAPLRAEVHASFLEDEESSKRSRKTANSSPDVSHTVVVKSGDTLPLLAQRIYGSAHYYLRLARANQLDDFRNLQPGQRLRFPPLAS